MSDYLSFEEVLSELNISEEDLRRMVSEGELRAFREENNKMKFRREDVNVLKSGGRPSQPTVVLGGQASDNEGTVLDLDSGELPAVPQETAVPELDFGGGEGEKAPTEEAGETTGITQETVFEDSDSLKVQPSDDSGGESGATFVEESSDTGAGTEALQVENEPGAAEAATEEEGAVTEEEAAAAPSKAPGRARVEAAEAAEPPKPSPAMTVLVGLAAILLAMVGYVMVDLIRVMTAEGAPDESPMVRKIRDMYPGKDKPKIEGAQPN